MLQFLRTHQRILFLVLTIVIVISFVFFGTYGTFMNPPSEEEVVVHKTIDGKDVTRAQVERLKRFLAADNEVLPTSNTFPNYLNTGFLHNEMIETGAIVQIALQSWEEVGAEIEGKLLQELAWRPYVHAESPHVSAQNVWQIFAPSIPQNLAKLQLAKERADLLEARFALMSAERAFPEPYLAQILTWQENKEPGLVREVDKLRGYLSLFGYKDPSDWMGVKLYDKVVYSWLDLAARARTEGLTVSDDDVKSYLKKASEEGRQKARVLQLDFLSLNSPETFYRQQLQIMHLTEEEAIEVCRPLLLVQKLIEKEKEGLKGDDSSFIEQAALENETVNLYEMDPSWRFVKAEDLYLFESYLEKVGKGPGLLAYAPVDLVQKRAPEFVKQSFRVELREVIAKDVPLKEVWTFQLSDEGWQRLQKKYRELGTAKTSEERAEVLDSLLPTLRSDIDFFSRQEIFKDKPLLAEELLDTAKAQITTLKLPVKGAVDLPLKGCKEASLLYSKLSAEENIKKITFDGGATFYRVIVLQKEGAEILPFNEAKKSLSQVKPSKYASLVASLTAEAKKAGFEKKAGESDADFAARMRFLKHMQKEKAHLEEKNTLQKELELVKEEENPWALKKRSLKKAEALKMGCQEGRLTGGGNHLIFTLPGADNKDEVQAKAGALAEAKCKKEAALKLFKGL